MPYKYIFDPKAAGDYEKAYLWYQQRSEMAAGRLIIEVEEAIKRICADPYRYRNAYKKLRESSLKKFPYTLIFLVDDMKVLIVITSLFHHKRNPKKKYGRTKL